MSHQIYEFKTGVEQIDLAQNAPRLRIEFEAQGLLPVDENADTSTTSSCLE